MSVQYRLVLTLEGREFVSFRDETFDKPEAERLLAEMRDRQRAVSSDRGVWSIEPV